jgi:hypothetical protein
MDKFRKYLDKFNDGELNPAEYFGDYDTFFSMLKSRNLLDGLDPIKGNDNENWQNEFLLFLLQEKEYKRFDYWIAKILDDVEFDESGQAYLVRGSRGDLADLFCSDRRNDLDRETIRKILEGDDVYEPYWETTDDVYRDVIEELNKENLEKLKEYIVKTLKGNQLSPETEEMELIAAEQGHNDYWEISEDNVSRILDDKESMESLMEDELSDMKSELYSIHNNSYNNAYEEEVYEKIWKELSEYFSGSGNFTTKQHPWKKDTQIEVFKVPISDIHGDLEDVLLDSRGYGSATLEYWGSFLGAIGEYKGCLSVYPPEYPDPSKVDKNINLYFSDYF